MIATIPRRRPDLIASAAGGLVVGAATLGASMTGKARADGLAIDIENRVLES